MYVPLRLTCSEGGADVGRGWKTIIFKKKKSFLAHRRVELLELSDECVLLSSSEGNRVAIVVLEIVCVYVQFKLFSLTLMRNT